MQYSKEMGLRIRGNTSRELKYKDIDSAELSATFLEIFFHELIKSLAHRRLIQILTHFFLVAESRGQHVREERSPRHITSELGEQGKCSLPIRREKFVIRKTLWSDTLQNEWLRQIEQVEQHLMWLVLFAARLLGLFFVLKFWMIST